MESKAIFVNTVVDDGRHRTGIAVLDEPVIENVRLIYGAELGKKMLYALTHTRPDGAYLFDRYRQLVVIIQ